MNYLIFLCCCGFYHVKMKRFSHQVYKPPVGQLSSSVPGAPARTSPLHLVVMHGLLGCHRNWQAVCSTLSSPPRSSAGAETCCFPCVAFDWRNHGASDKSGNHSLDGLAEDIDDFVSAYARHELSHSSSSSATSGQKPNQIPVVLMAHSMGGAALMHFLWKSYCRSLAEMDSTRSDESGTPDAAASTLPYRVVGAIIVDIGPCARPKQTMELLDAIRFLPQLPLDLCTTQREMETWLMQHGPPTYFNEDNIWMIKYVLSNVDMHAKPYPKWKVGLHEIIQGLDKIHWPDDNHLRTKSQRVSPMINPPVKFIFGGRSPYHNPVALDAIPCYFANNDVDVIPNGSHFLFIEQKQAFCASVRSFLMSRHQDLSSDR